MRLLDLLMDFRQPILAATPRIVREWFSGPKMEDRYWRWTLIALLCWTALAALISAWVISGPGFAPICFLPVLAVLVLPAWGTLAIGWRVEAGGGVLGVTQGLLLCSVLGGGFFCVTGVVAHSLFLSLPVSLPPFVIGILCLVGWWRSRTAQREERGRAMEAAK
jgi:hypothetical protein